MLKKSRFCVAALLSLFMLFALCSSAFAATVGQQLTTPEEGWKRYDDTNTAITFVGSWVTLAHPQNYKGSYKTSGTSGDSYNFTFSGTGVRLIAYRDNVTNVTTNNATVDIDGITENVSFQGPVQYQTLLYEKSNLSEGIHSVKVTTKVSGLYLMIDAIDIKGDLINTSINAPNNLIAASGDSKVDLNWTPVSGAGSYNVKRSTTSAGLYTTIASSVTGTTYSDTNVINGTTYYYVVTAVNASGESANSNEASATPQAPIVQPETGRAILTITLDTGLEREFDLSMAEVNSFISWYEGKAVGSGTASYAIDKHDNNKGPFKNRKDYVIFDKILTFEVNEYEVTE